MRFDISNQDILDFLDAYVISRTPLKFKEVPAREKRKYVMLCIIIHAIDKDKVYHELELNALLKPMIDDYVMIRRYLVDYGFLKRQKDGSQYWLNVDLNQFLSFKIS